MANDIANILLLGGQTIGIESFYEVRIENDAVGNPLYVGRSPIANANTAETVWFIIKLSYDANVYLNHVQQPNGGNGFFYAWDDRATYF